MDKLLTIKQDRKNETDIANSINTSFEIDGKPLAGVFKAELCFEVEEFVVANLHMWGTFDDIHGLVPKFYMTHPEENVPKEVSSIKFADGSEYEF